MKPYNEINLNILSVEELILEAKHYKNNKVKKYIQHFNYGLSYGVIIRVTLFLYHLEIQIEKEFMHEIKQALLILKMKIIIHKK